MKRTSGILTVLLLILILAMLAFQSVGCVRSDAVEPLRISRNPSAITLQEHPRLDIEAVDSAVQGVAVTLTIPRTVVIGNDIEIEGTANTGAEVNLFVEGILVAKDVAINNGEFSADIVTGIDALVFDLKVTGTVKIEVVVDEYVGGTVGTSRIGDQAVDADASAIVLIVSEGLTAEQDDDVLTTEDEDYGISGTAVGVDEVAVIVSGPKGGSQIMTAGESFEEIPVVDNMFEEDDIFTTNTDMDTGTYTTVIVSRGCDGVYGQDIDMDLSDRYAKGTAGDLTSKTASQILEILEADLWGAAGSDDLYFIMQFTVESAWIMLDEIADVGAGEPLNVTGTTNRADYTSILVTIDGPSVLAGDVTEVEDGAFSATIDTEDAAEGTYTITADDGDGNTDTTTVEILAPANYPPTAIIDSLTPNPAKQGRDIVSFTGHGTDSDGSIVAYNWTSSLDGLLNTSASFTKPAAELSVGTHTIYFKVQDDYGAWSSPATENLVIEAANQSPGRWDVNADGTVNFIDLTILSAHWLETPTAPYPRYDINEDGAVNFIDLAILSAHWLETTC